MLIVKAKPGIKAPLLHKPKNYIPEDRFIAVEDSHYYRAMLSDGDLVEATEQEWAAQQEADALAEAEAIAAAEKAKADAAAAEKAQAAKAAKAAKSQQG